MLKLGGPRAGTADGVRTISGTYCRPEEHRVIFNILHDLTGQGSWIFYVLMSLKIKLLLILRNYPSHFAQCSTCLDGPPFRSDADLWETCVISGFRREVDRTAFWVTTHLVVVNPCRRFGTTYRPHLQESGPQVVPQLWQGITTTRCVILQKYTAPSVRYMYIFPSIQQLFWIIWQKTCPKRRDNMNNISNENYFKFYVRRLLPNKLLLGNKNYFTAF